MLKPLIKYGVDAAVKEAYAAKGSGFERSPRIRFSHIGEMIATPKFTNWLAHEIKETNRNVQCVVYTRHVEASEYDPNLFVVNFTVDGSGGDRLIYMPVGARLVASAWDGNLNAVAEINFLEHHSDRHSSALGQGPVCPVTADHSSAPTCDLAKCDKCFQKTG